MNLTILKLFLAKIGVTVPAGAGAPQTVAVARALTAADNGATLLYTGAADGTFTIPKDLVTGFKVSLIQGAAGQAIVAGASGVTVNAKGGTLQSAVQYSKIDVTNSDTNKYIVSGDVGALA
jgi:hypothetical protein